MSQAGLSAEGAARGQTSADTLEVVRQVLAEVTSDAGFDPMVPLQVDSLQALKVLVELETRLDVEIDELELFAGWFETGVKIAQYLDQLLGRGEPLPAQLATTSARYESA